MDSEAVYNSITAAKVKVSLILAITKSSNFEMIPQKADASALIAHSDSSHRSARDLIFLPGFLATRRAMVQTATTLQSRLVALIAVSVKRYLGGSSSSSKKRGSGGGAGSAAGGRDRATRVLCGPRAAPVLPAIDAGDLYTVFDPGGLSQQWTVNEYYE